MKRAILALVLVSIIPSLHAAELRLGHLFHDHMVLQRELTAPVWGWADPGDDVTVAFAGRELAATAGADGYWRDGGLAVPSLAHGTPCLNRGRRTMTESASRPNILFITTDQQSSTMMSCAGNEYLQTPAMDRLAREGVRFERAYCTNPVCLPSRFSWFTGRMPSELDIWWNTTKQHVPTGSAKKEPRVIGPSSSPCVW